MRLRPTFGDASDVVETGAIAQWRRKGDRHELNALRTWASAVRPPEPPSTLLLPQILTLTAKHGTFVARQRNAGSFRRFRPRIKKNSFRTRVFRPFRDLSWKLFIPVLMGRAPSPAMGRDCREGRCVVAHPDATETAAFGPPRGGRYGAARALNDENAPRSHIVRRERPIGVWER